MAMNKAHRAVQGGRARVGDLDALLDGVAGERVVHLVHEVPESLSASVISPALNWFWLLVVVALIAARVPTMPTTATSDTAARDPNSLPVLARRPRRFAPRCCAMSGIPSCCSAAEPVTAVSGDGGEGPSSVFFGGREGRLSRM